MAIGFVLTVDDVQIRAGLDRALRFVTDWDPFLDDVGAELESSTLERFDANVSPDGVPWVQSAAALSRGDPTLQDTRQMRDGIHYEKEATAVLVGSNAVQAAAYQNGYHGEVVVGAHSRHFTMVFGRHIEGDTVVMPHSRKMDVIARPFLGISANDDRAIHEILGDHLARAVGARR
jgi:phage gpG-like protein